MRRNKPNIHIIAKPYLPLTNNPKGYIIKEINKRMQIMRNVVITGGSRGIGAAMAKAFSKNGDRVFIIYKKSDEDAEKLKNEYGVIPVKADISNPDDVLFAESEVHKTCGGIDVLINNAGISQIKLFSDITDDDWRNVMGVNFDGTFFVTRAFLPDMINKKAGKIINVSSMWGEVGASCEVHYSASKAAQIGFTKALAKELAPSGITVNCITPGVIETEMNEGLSEETKRELIEEIPLMRMGKAEEVANLALFLASDKADYITGQVIGISGGMVI